MERVRGRAREPERVGVARRRSTRVERAARGGDNLVPPIIAAVEAQATVGEIADAMRRVFGEYIADDAQAVADGRSSPRRLQHLTTGFDVPAQ